MRGRSFQVGRTGVSELSSTSGSECAARATACVQLERQRPKELSGVERRERTNLIKFVT